MCRDCVYPKTWQMWLLNKFLLNDHPCEPLFHDHQIPWWVELFPAGGFVSFLQKTWFSELQGYHIPSSSHTPQHQRWEVGQGPGLSQSHHVVRPPVPLRTNSGGVPNFPCLRHPPPAPLEGRREHLPPRFLPPLSSYLLTEYLQHPSPCPLLQPLKDLHLTSL